MVKTDGQNNGKRKKTVQNRPPHAEEAERAGVDTSEREPGENGYQPTEIEPFVPTDFYPSTHVRGRRGRTRRKKRALWALLIAAGVLLLAVAGAFAYIALLDPSKQFVNATETPDSAEVISIEGADATAEPGMPTPTPTLDPYDVISAQADPNMLQQNIVNILLIGVDYAEERVTWGGKHEYHSDVMIVMAINFDENRVDLISLPRDTYAKIPGIKGIYKLNASINCGGGFEAPGGTGFLKTCEAANWMLGEAGEIYPINYYYAVTMPAVKELVNAIGGVDYDLDVSFTMMGRSYTAGPTHLNGQGVLDYLRVRKNVAGAGDLYRINRQKEMLIAIFESMQKKNLILKAPEIISSFDGQLYTNCSFGQTAALTKFAYTLDKDNIGMYSMDGTEPTSMFGWNFVLTNQTKRVQIIKEVYGIDVPQELEYTYDYADYRWKDIIATHYLEITQPLVNFVAQALAEDDLLPTMSPTPEPTPEFFDTPYPADTSTPDPTASSGSTGSNSAGIVRLSAVNPVLGESYRRFTDQSRIMFDDFQFSLDALEEAQAIARKEAKKYAEGKSNNLKNAAKDVGDYSSHVKTNAIALAQEFGYYDSIDWTFKYWLDRDFNEVIVDFN
jgi:LCP family protein required for cell wall assembly